MGRIRVLDPLVVNQIAAGEVIERPASVVKELVENAIDAGAGRIEVRLEDGGRGVIEVSDDGEGMDEDDLARAFLPHATSKITAISDLDLVASLGFRGEALASIGSVSRATIVSRRREAATGAAVEDREGAIGEVRPAGASPGTVVRVEGLFSSVPARRKFLRAASTETGHCADLLSRIAVAHPEKAFRLVQRERVLLDLPRGDTRRARIGRLHGEDLARDLLEVRAEAHPLELEGFVGPPSRTRPDGRLEQVFVNGRFVRDRTVSHALREAFRDLLPPGNHRPVAFLFFSVDPAFVDVNVHPAKAEVRWRESAAVHSLVHRAVRAALEAASPGVAVPVGGLRRETVEAAEFAFTHGVGKVPFDRVAPSAPWGVEARHDASGHAHAGTHPVLPEPTCGGAPAVTSRLRPLGQALGTYLVFEGEQEIVLVDQHALHERVLFDRIEARLKEEGRLEVQRLLVPVVVSLSAAESAALAEEAELLASLGWIVEPFGEGSVAVHGLPAVLRRPQPEVVLLEVLRLVEEGRRDGADATHLISAAIDRIACRSAVMAGDTIQPEEALALLEEAERLDHSHTCPHGRPTRLTLRRGDLERWFHR